jgi:hypothetical protein
MATVRPQPRPVAEADRDLDRLHGDEIVEAMGRAVREAIWRHKQLGESIVVWRDGRIVTVPPEEIEVERPEPRPRPPLDAGR